MMTTHQKFWNDKQGIYENGLIHELTHVNEEQRAARTRCGQYIELWPDAVEQAEYPTCLGCLGAPDIDVATWRKAHEDVNERWQDVVRHCTNHLYHRDEQGRCSRCGYTQPKQQPGRFGGDGV